MKWNPLSYISEEIKMQWIVRLIQFASIMFLFVYILVYFNFLAKDKKASSDRFPWYIVGLIVPVTVLTAMIFMKVEDKRFFLVLIVGALITLIAFAPNALPFFISIFTNGISFFLEYTLYTGLSPETSFLISFFIKFLLVVIIIIGLSLFYNVFLNESYKQTGWTGFAFYMLFFLPCLLSDYIAYLFEEFKMTPRVVYVLLLLELLFILLWLYVPYWLRALRKAGNGTLLLGQPVFLRQTRTIGKNPFHNSDISLSLANYTLSMWITVNTPQVSPSNETMLFRYGPKDVSYGYPYVAYTQNDMWKIAVAQTDFIEIYVPSQRWNNLVFNYNNQSVDFFLNGVLVRTIPLANTDLSGNRDVMIGSQSNNIHGAICNVNAFMAPLSQTDIVQTYNLLQLKNPPLL